MPSGVSRGLRPLETRRDTSWRKRAERAMRRVGIVGVPMDLGAGRRGVDMGPSAIRYAGLERDLLAMGLSVVDYHNIAVPGPESGDIGDPHARYERLIEHACSALRSRVAEIVRGGDLPLVL